MIDHLNTQALAALPDDAPVTMLNLMRFRKKSLDGNGSGWDAYLRYSALTIKLIKGVGGTITWTGNAEAMALGVPEENQWDYVALVRYPSRQAFIAMMMSGVRAIQRRARKWLRGPYHHRDPRDLQASRELTGGTGCVGARLATRRFIL